MRLTRLVWLFPLALLVCGCPGPKKDSGASQTSITVKGSDTMVHLVTAWAEAFMKKHPGQMVSVTGGGSGTGIAAMINGTTDVAMASRDMKEKELKLAEKQGTKPLEHTVARDGIAVVAHPENPVSALTLDQLRQLYNGTLTNWNQVGGADREVSLLSRESNSGTYVFFNEFVLKKDDFAARAKLMPSSAAIIQAAVQDEASLGYVGLGYTQDAKVKVLDVKPDAESAAVRPTLESIQGGSYPISRPLFLYTKGEPQGVAKAFLDFALSAEGQKIVEETGYIPLKAAKSTK